MSFKITHVYLTHEEEHAFHSPTLQLKKRGPPIKKISSRATGFVGDVEHGRNLNHERNNSKGWFVPCHDFIMYIWATAFIYVDEKKMWRQAGFEEMLVSPAKRDQNEMGGLQKRDRFWCASYLWTYWCQRLENETNHGGKVPKPEKRD